MGYGGGAGCALARDAIIAKKVMISNMSVFRLQSIFVFASIFYL